MRLLIVSAVFGAMCAVPALAKDESGTAVGLSCAEQAALVVEAVDARVDGARKGKTRRGLRDALGRNAGDMLADWIWSLPEDALTADSIAQVADAWEAQCASL